MSLRIVSRHSSAALRTALASSSRSYGAPRSPYDLEDDDEPSLSSSSSRSSGRHTDVEPASKRSRGTEGGSQQSSDGIARHNPFEPPALRYTQPDVRPDVEHPSYRPTEIMDFRDESAKLPPALAVQRHSKLRAARQAGVHHSKLNNSRTKPKLPPPIVPVRVQGRPKEEKVQYVMGRTGISNEQNAYYEDGLDVEGGEPVSMATGASVSEMDWEGTEGEVPELEPGRIVEFRRSGQSSVGMVLASMMTSGRSALLMLRSTGEIWPINHNDVQYIMPSSLVDPALARACWSPELVALWAEGVEATTPEMADAVKPMQVARRQAVLILRKVMRETERMCGKMIGDIGRSQFGGIEGVWDQLVPQEGPTTTTAREAAEFMLNARGSGPHVRVKANTLPAYAAHCLMMNRSDLFVADPTSMGVTGTFYVRSRAERDNMQRVSRLLHSQSVEDQAVLARFLEKARKAVLVAQKARDDAPEGTFVEVKHDIPEWTEEERLILSSLVSNMYEKRTTQVFEQDGNATNIMKMTKAYGDVTVDRNMLPQFLTDLGVFAPWDSLKPSETREIARRGIESSREKAAVEGLLQGNELDELRHDFTDQKVFVIDDASASELDDGISIERIPGSDAAWIHVHVADPTRFVALNSDIAARASFQGSAAYLPEGSIPMLPLEVVMKELSLGANVSRDEGRQGTMTFSSKLSAGGEVLDSRVRMGWIQKPRVITYESVNKALGVEGRDTIRPLGTPLDLPPQPDADVQLSAEDIEDLRLVQTLAQACRHRRLAHAGLEWETPSSDLRILNQLPELSSNVFDPRLLPARPSIYVGSPRFDLRVSPLSKAWTGLPATMIVAEMMVMAGRNAARFCSERGLAAPFRICHAPTPIQMPGKKLVSVDEILAQRDPVSNFSDAAVAVSAALKFNPSEVSMSPGPQWIMGITDNAGYVRGTSPLRRFDDLLVHWQIKAALAREKGLGGDLARTISTDDMARLVARSEPAQRRLKRIGTTAKDWWAAGLVMSRMRNPRPEGYEYGPDWVDPLGPLTAVVAKPTIYSWSAGVKNTTPVTIPALGLSARIPGFGQTDYRIGQELPVRIIGAQQWSAPIIDVALIDT